MREMKDSGVEWIGEIPKDWEIIKTKYVADISIGLVTTMTANYVDNLDDGVYLIRNGDIRLNKISKEKMVYISRKFVEQNASRQLLENDIVTVHTGYIGTSAIIREDFIGSVGFATIQSRPNLNIINERYLCWFYNSPFFIKQCMLHNTGDGRQNLNLYDFVDFYVYQPPLAEQQQIADYLDTKCSEIDATAEDIQKEISLLEDYKKSLITEAVTKGLNPDAEMKDSGIAWIGEIPKDWDLLKIGYVTKEISDIDHYMPSDSDDIDKVPYLMIGDLKENISQIDFESCKSISKKVYRALSIKSKPEKENVIFARYATIGTVCFVDSEKQLLVSYACLTVKANELIKGRFLFYYFKSNAFLEEVSQYVKSNTQGNIGKESLIRAKIVVPKLKEQTQIISYLDSKCSEIDAIIADKKCQLDILAEYKKSLIYEYVTGKKEVPVHE